MTFAYTPPGVTVTELSSPSISPLLGSAADICVIGVAGTLSTSQTAISTTDTLILSGTGPHTLPTLAALNNGQLVAVQSVKDILNPSVGTPLGAGYVATTDYTVTLGEGPPSGTNGTITRVGNGSIPDGALVAVTYTYLPVDYWEPVRFFDIGSVETRYGNSWATSTSTVTGKTYYTGIGSQLSMAARIAFENGAQSVICQPLFARATPGDPTTAQVPPTANAIGDQTTWEDTLYALRPIQNIDVVVPVIGQDGINVSDSAMLNIFSAVQSHLAYMNTQEQYMVAIFGEDGTTEGVGTANSGLINTLRSTHAPALQSNFANQLSSQCVLINNTVFQRATPGGTGTSINVGGQYVAAAVAGALSARAVSSSLTRKTLNGFQSVIDPRTPADKNTDAGAGLMVVEQIPANLIRIRQANTLDTQNGPARSELSVVRSKFLLIESIKDTLDNQIIGNIIADGNSPVIVRSAISSVLSLLQQAGAIVGYSQVNAALTNLNPTTITASFSYQPAFPVNFVKVTFSLDLTQGTVTTTNTSG